MTNSYDVDHGLSQVAPGPLEPVELPASLVSTVEQDPPAAYLTLDEEGSPCMLFFDVVEARTYCEVGEEPLPLYRRPAPAAGDARDAALRRAVTLLLQVHPLLGPCDHELRDRIGAYLGEGGAA